MEKEPKNSTPFRDKTEVKETASFEFDVSRFESDDRFVIKTLKKEYNASLSEEAGGLTLKDYIKERYLDGYKLLKQYLGDTVPTSRFVIGQNEASVEPQLYLVQDRVEGLNAADLMKKEMMLGTVGKYRHDDLKNKNSSREITGHFQAVLYEAYKHKNLEIGLMETGLDKCQHIFDMLQQLDNVMCNSFKMWEATLDSDEALPLGLTADRQIRTKQPVEGLFPEVTNFQNLIYGKTYKDNEPKLYLIDNGLILVSKSIMTGNTDEAIGFLPTLQGHCLLLRDFREWLSRDLPSTSGNFFDKYRISDQEKEKMLKMLKSGSGDYYDQLLEKYSND